MYKAPDYIAFAIPVFFLLIGIELVVGRLTHKRYYRLNDALTNISCGIGQQVLKIFVQGLLFAAYIWLYENAKLLEIPQNWWTWLILLVGVDFFYYWFHRYSHEISLMWGGHVVHHQSEEYNLSVALRQGAFQAFFSWVFYLPLAVAGFHPVAFLVVNQFQTLYQFWIHTRAIGKLPWAVELIFNTPSHHRVHHGINPEYIDKNHAGTFIIWDRMFGTFQEEKEEVVYGVTKPLASWNPIWANFDYYRDLFKTAFQCRNPQDFFRVFFKGPGWRPAYLGGPQHPGAVKASTFKKFDTTVKTGINIYVLVQFIIVLGISSLFLFTADKFPEIFPEKISGYLKIAAGGVIFYSIMSLGIVLESRSWSLFSEVFRWVLSVTLVFFLLKEGGQTSDILLVISGIGVLSILWLILARNKK